VKPDEPGKLEFCRWATKAHPIAAGSIRVQPISKLTYCRKPEAEFYLSGRPGSPVIRVGWVTETLRSILPRIEEYGLNSADNLQIDTLVTRMEAEARIRQTQLIGRSSLEARQKIQLGGAQMVAK
jgi:hypothetical protein